jgi:hypothetical protein
MANKTLVYTCGYGDVYGEYAKMCMHTLRLSGYTGDALIFTDRDMISEHSECLNVNNHKNKEYLVSGKHMRFHRSVGLLTKHFKYDFFFFM